MKTRAWPNKFETANSESHSLVTLSIDEVHIEERFSCKNSHIITFDWSHLHLFIDSFPFMVSNFRIEMETSFDPTGCYSRPVWNQIRHNVHHDHGGSWWMGIIDEVRECALHKNFNCFSGITMQTLVFEPTAPWASPFVIENKSEAPAINELHLLLASNQSHINLLFSIIYSGVIFKPRSWQVFKTVIASWVKQRDICCLHRRIPRLWVGKGEREVILRR